MHLHPSLRAAGMLALLFTLVTLPCAPAHAQTYPDKPVRLYIAGTLGTVYDVVGRILGQQLARELGQPVVTDNQMADNFGVLLADTVAKFEPDGYSLYLGSEISMTTAMHLKKKFPYDPLTDFTPVAAVAQEHYVLVVNPEVPAATVAEFIEYAKKNKVGYASDGAGTTRHLGAAAFAGRAGFEAAHLPQPTAVKAMDSLVAGEAQFMVVSLSAARLSLRAKKIKALGVADPVPYAPLENVPTIAATLPGYQIDGWYGVFGPAHMPPAVVARLNAAVNKALATPELQARVKTLLLASVTGGSADELGAMVKTDFEARGKLAVQAGFEKN